MVSEDNNNCFSVGAESLADRMARLEKKRDEIEPTGELTRPRKAVKGVRFEDIDPNIDLEALTWSRRNRIPKGLCLLTGREGSGKSRATDWLTYHYSTGTAWPDGQPCEAGTVLLFDSENSPERKLIKLRAIGCDMSRIEVFDVDRVKATGLSVVEIMKTFIEQHPDTVLVVIDVGRNIDTRLGGDDVKLDEGLTDIKLFALNRLPVFLIHHEGKMTENRDARDRARGSVYWTTNARLHWSLSRNENYGVQAVTIEVGKANDAPFASQTPLQFNYESRTTEDGFEFGALQFIRTIPLEEFKPVESAEDRAAAKRGRKPKVEPDQITEAILETLQANGGRMPGRMPSELKNETIKDSAAWRTYAANVVSERLGISADNVYRHFSSNMKDRTIDGWFYWSVKGSALNDHWFWAISQDSTERDDSDGE